MSVRFPPISRYAKMSRPSLPHPDQTQPQHDSQSAILLATTRSLPNFGFKHYPNPLPTATPDAKQIPQSHNQVITEDEQTKTLSRLLAIPLEIRLQIYTHVLASSKIHHAYLAPLASEQPTSSDGLNTEEFHTVMLRPANLSTPRSISTPHSSSQIKFSAVSRGVNNGVAELVVGNGREGKRESRGKLPASLLRSCSQVYGEARHLPFEKGSFGFINWFWSGIYAARGFSRNLEGWQREGVRCLGIEVLGKDLWMTGAGEGKGLEGWVEVCRLWGGVREVRMCVKGGLGVDGAVKTLIDGDESLVAGEEKKCNMAKGTVLDVKADWATRGLCQLKALRYLELEIEDGDVGREEKVAFCADLAVLLNGPGQGGDVKVVFKEKIEVEREVPNKSFPWFGGEPGDELVWGHGVGR